MKRRTSNNIIFSINKIIYQYMWQQQINLFFQPCLVVVALASMLLLSGQLSQAQTIYVDACTESDGDGSEANPFKFLATAKDAAAPGSTIVLHCGNYDENLTIDKQLNLISSGGPAHVGVKPDHLWAGSTNGDIFDEPDTPIDNDPDKTLGAMLDKLVAANLRVLSIIIDYRLELSDEDGDGDGHADALPFGEYNDCILEAIDHLMVEVKQRGILLHISLQSFNWIDSPYLMSREHYGWRRCKTPAKVYADLSSDPDWAGEEFKSPYQQRKEEFKWEDYYTDPTAKKFYKERVKHILNHRNPYLNNRKWKDIDDVIWAWGIGREQGAGLWMDEMSAYVKSIDPDTYTVMGSISDKHLRDYYASVDIYTLHSYLTIHESEVLHFLSPEGIGGKYGKLLFVEEFTPYRSTNSVYVEIISKGGCFANADAVRFVDPTGSHTPSDFIIDNTGAPVPEWANGVNASPYPYAPGTWEISNAPSHYGEDSVHSDDPDAIFRFRVQFADAKLFFNDVREVGVYLWWPSSGRHCSDTQIRVSDDNGLNGFPFGVDFTTIVNQTIDGGQWNKIGTFQFGYKPYNTTSYLNLIQDYESWNIPWMFWEYGYKFDHDDLWHSGEDAILWNEVIVPHAKTMWNTKLCGCQTSWRVGEMVRALINNNK